MLSFHTAPLRGRVAAEPSAALVPTLGAIEKCKFILLLPRFSPHAKRSSGITAPRSDSLGSVGAAGQGNSPAGTGWDGQL